MPKGGAQPGAGRPKGGKNKSTIERETLAAQRALEQAKAVQPFGGTKLAIQEMQKALVLAEGMAKAYQPIMERDSEGKITLKGGDHVLFKEWTKIWIGIQSDLAKYQSPPMKAIEAPTPPPDPAAEDAARNAPPRKRLTLRVFDGGRQVSGPPDPAKAS